ncbi:hypothetical protein SAMN05216174_101365 [Actinokineospora iranica]|uniref:Uncharacterized protein n=1 Tax=Actinokineospora iranica TaxID=1271860 RepID=A0A1G6JGD4_9PSEU|nr:hypothetical protein SAMN05216174_101365 [Actinokineospora iranica]
MGGLLPGSGRAGVRGRGQGPQAVASGRAVSHGHPVGNGRVRRSAHWLRIDPFPAIVTTPKVATAGRKAARVAAGTGVGRGRYRGTGLPLPADRMAASMVSTSVTDSAGGTGGGPSPRRHAETAP